MTIPSVPRESRNYAILLLVLTTALFFANTWGYDLWPADEPRFGEVPREMMQSGNYLQPQCNGEPYKEKPPLLFWLIVLLSLPFGDVTEFSARAASALAGTATVLLTYRLAARLYDRRVGFWSALILATMALFWWEARSVRTDMLLTACMTGALAAFCTWHETRLTRWLLAFYAALALGLLTKGPPALIFPLLLILVFYWGRKADRRQTHWMLGTLAALAVVMAWFIPARLLLPSTPGAAGSAAMGGELFSQIVGRLFLGSSKAEWPWFFLWNVPASMFPWVLFLPWVLPWVWKRRREDDRMRLLLAWAVPTFIFFSISVGKRNVYLLPIYPVLAILTARGVLDLCAGDRARWRKRTAAVCGVILMLVGLAPLAIRFSEYRDLWSNTFLVLVVCGIGLGLDMLRRALWTDAPGLHRLIAGQFVFGAIMTAFLFFPALNTYKGAREFCRPLSNLARAGTNYDLYSLGFSREEYVFYSRHFHQRVLTDALPVTLTHDVDFITTARQQMALRKAIAKAVAKVPVESVSAPTDAEIEALQAAVQQAIETTKADPELARAFQAALTQTMHEFAVKFEGAAPAFMFVQQEDWKWLLPLLPHLAKYPVVGRDIIGRRSVLLIANDSGARLVAAGGA